MFMIIFVVGCCGFVYVVQQFKEMDVDIVWCVSVYFEMCGDVFDQCGVK